MSPFIFTLVGESLNKLVMKAKELGIVKDITVTHLQFADDIFFLCEPKKEEVKGFKAILRFFELVSELKINLVKNTLIGIDVEDEHLKELEEEIGCGTGKMPFTYLGLPVGGKPRSKRFWAPVVEGIERRLEGWSCRYLSLGGRLTLIKSVISNLSIYYLSIFEMAIGVGKKIEQLFRNFLWGDREARFTW